MRFTRSLAAALLLATPGLALAQNVSFTNLGRGVMGPFGPPQNLVARSQAEFDSQGMSQLLDPAALIAPIDWSKEMVVATLMGTRNTGGYSIQITEIRREQLFVILPVPGPPPSWELVVKYRTTSPPAGSFVPQVITAPYHMVRLPRHAGTVRFEQVTPPPADVFNSAWLEYDTGPIGGTGEGVHIDVNKSGAVTASRFAPNALFQPVNGQATAAELQRLKSAIERARAASLPPSIPAGVVFIVQPQGFQTAIFSDRPALNGSFSGTLGHYDAQYEARVKPLVDAFKAIGDRVLQGASGSVFTGRIAIPAGGGIRLIDQNGGGNYRLTPADKASELARWNGRTVRVRGALQSAGPNMQLRVTEIISPEHEPLQGLAQVQNGRPVVLVGSPFITAPLRAVRTSGPAARTLRLAEGNNVNCDAYVFTDANGQPVEAHIESVDAVMTRTTRVLNGWNFLGLARQGDGIHVLELSSTGTWVKIKHQVGIGWVRTDRVRVGTPFMPQPVPLTSTGFTGAIPE